MEGDYWIIDSPDILESHIESLRVAYKAKGFVIAKYEIEDTRSSAQNNALHLYCKRLAEALNDAGLDKLKVFKEGAEIPWTAASVKEDLWRPVQKSMTGKASTTKASRTQYTEIYEALNRHIASRFGVSVSWPSNQQPPS